MPHLSERQPVTAPASALDLYRLAELIRAFELRTGELRRDGRIPGDVHLCTGQEGPAVAVSRSLRTSDVVTSTHRCHGHALAKGVEPRAIFAELLGRDAGACRGRGGSMHVAAPEIGFFGGNGIVAGNLPIAAGAALAARRRGEGDVVVAFFGDGAVGQGAFHETVNLTVQWRLPVLFLCENNGYAASTRTDERQLPLAERARGYGLDHVAAEGDDVVACADLLATAIAGLRDGGAPLVVEARTWRWAGHWEGDPQAYRADEEQAEARLHDPVERLRADLVAAGTDPAALEHVREEVAATIDEALRWALAQPEPDPAAMTDFVAAPLTGDDAPPAAASGRRRYRVIDAVHAALRDELERDPSVLLAGIDLNVGLTRKLQQRWPDRVLDTPISEAAVVGMGAGAAMAGLRPVVEILYMDFITVCFDQIVNQAAKLHYLTGGSARVPLTIRTQFGALDGSGAQHSQSLEALLAHVPGLIVAMPSNPADAYGLLRAAIQHDSPVVVLEHRGLYELSGARPDDGGLVPLGRARIVREGADVSVIAVSRMVREAEAAADALAGEGVDCEVVDLRTIAPLDRAAIVASARKTGRVVVAHEAVCDFGIGAEVAAILAHDAFDALRAPVVRVGAPRTPVPYAPSLERAWVPDADAIAAAVRRVARQAPSL